MKKRLSSTVLRSAGPCVVGVVALLFTATFAAPALAGKCKYLGGTTDNGPCLEVRNRHKWRINDAMNLWCLRGPTQQVHKIVLRAGDSFTCKGRVGGGNVAYVGRIQRKQAGCDPCFHPAPCDGKTVASLWKRKHGETIEVTCE